MRRIEFPGWAEILGEAELSPRVKHSFGITIRWYLSFCRRARAEVTVPSARDFIAWAMEEKHPQPWQMEEWKEAIRWFFLAAKEQKCQVEGDSPSLALNERLSASSQRQALNALVFLYREVFQKELGDFSEYRRARARTNLPVWLTWDELTLFFDCLDDQTRLMAQVMYGSGLRLMELLRLRVKDLDFPRGAEFERRGSDPQCGRWNGETSRIGASVRR